jgi:tRNA U55 pseudouridine synthase TruB
MPEKVDATGSLDLQHNNAGSTGETTKFSQYLLDADKGYET